MNENREEVQLFVDKKIITVATFQEGMWEYSPPLTRVAMQAYVTWAIVQTFNGVGDITTYKNGWTWKRKKEVI